MASPADISVHGAPSIPLVLFLLEATAYIWRRFDFPLAISPPPMCRQFELFVGSRNRTFFCAVPKSGCGKFGTRRIRGEQILPNAAAFF
jgi:hypothetical protein